MRMKKEENVVHEYQRMVVGSTRMRMGNTKKMRMTRMRMRMRMKKGKMMFSFYLHDHVHDQTKISLIKDGNG